MRRSLLFPLSLVALLSSCLTGPHENDVPSPGRFNLEIRFTLDGALRSIEGDIDITESSTDGLHYSMTVAGAPAGSGVAKWVNPDGFRITGTTEGLSLVTHLKKLGEGLGCRGWVEQNSSGTRLVALCTYRRIGSLPG